MNHETLDSRRRNTSTRPGLFSFRSISAGVGFDNRVVAVAFELRDDQPAGDDIFIVPFGRDIRSGAENEVVFRGCFVSVSFLLRVEPE